VCVCVCVYVRVRVRVCDVKINRDAHLLYQSVTALLGENSQSGARFQNKYSCLGNTTFGEIFAF